ncbi:MAG: biotin/lipoyl-binding protein, partial [Deltaproteobacteria bacterium]|nr:biotin/lipoyl-binding protein [Deltaproteobacteria bacterium]
MPKLPTHIENAETSSKKVILAGIAIIIIFGSIFVAWGTLASLHGAVQAQGTVMVDSRRKTVQHLEGGIINSILVKEGDRVTAGQPLIILADLQAKASVELLS